MPIELYELDSSPFCRAVKLISNLINVPLKLTKIDLFKEEQLKPEFLEKSPFHQVPVINDDGFYLSESRAIAAYLVDKYSPDNTLYPKDLQTRAVIEQMLYFDCGTLAPAFLQFVHKIYYEKCLPGPDVLEKAKKSLTTLDLVLSKRKYVAGDVLTIADICIRTTLTLNDVLNDLDISEFKNVDTWAQRVIDETNPAYSEINDEPTSQLSQIMKNIIVELKLKK